MEIRATLLTLFLNSTKHITKNMAKSSDSGGTIFKTGLFAILAGLAFWIFNRSSGTGGDAVDIEKPTTEAPTSPAEVKSEKVPDYLPKSKGGEEVQHTWFTLSYSEDHEQAAWVAYELTRKQLDNKWADRAGMLFRPDPNVRTESATPRDYTGSGYDRGHLCPAADMSFDTTALQETFFMSNISPQAKGFNTGVWREMEELTRDWARKYDRIFVVTGPILSRKGIAQIGFSKVTVPVGFYKAIYAPKQHIAIGFAVPNQKSDKPVMEYAFNLDYVEQLTNIDFFPELMSGSNEAPEKELDKSLWPVNEKRYNMRVQQWNKD
jgi:endonuclease G